MRLLFIAPNRIGDAVIASGILDHLVRANPGARVTVACGAPAAGVFQRLPGLERLIPMHKSRNDRHWLALWWQVVRHRWDLVVDTKGSALSYLVPTRRRAVYRSSPSRKYVQYAEALGLHPAPLPTPRTAPEDRAQAHPHRGDGPVLGLGPTANWDGKLWPADRFAALAAAVAASLLPGARPAILGGPGPAERAMARPVLDRIPGAIDLVGRLTIAETAACIDRCALYAGNDSGLMHLAAATGTPTIGLCGATMDRAVEMAPAGPYAAWAMAEAPAMDALSVETVLAAARTLLHRRRTDIEAPADTGPVPG